jgi:hypothetical protein
MTHIENIPHILRHGITHSTSPDAHPAFVPIGDSNIISTRNQFVLNNGRRLGEYIPFYFSIKTPMLYVVQKGYNMVQPTPAENIVYCVTSVQKILDLNLSFVFTDGHAIDGFTTQYLPEDIYNLDKIIDWNAVNAKYWRNENDLDLKRKKEAEFMVMGDIDYSAVLGFITYNEMARNKLIEYGVPEKQTVVRRNYYF